MKRRAELDKLAWAILHGLVPSASTPPGLAASGRPCNYVELAELTERWDKELAWSEFLHEFFRYKAASFFVVPPPPSFTPERRALLAGVAEFLCAEFNLEAPAWIKEPEFFLSEMWDPWEDICPDVREFRDERIARSHKAFLRRNVVYEARNLITL